MTEICIFQKNATYLDRDYMELLVSKFNHIEYIKKKLLPGMVIVELDDETGEMKGI